ncbi:MAG: tandem-95 repeat protein, partial [Rhodopirellula sp.]|nr:tandem-95 repeat protein [Rhodopirellula sp.]
MSRRQLSRGRHGRKLQFEALDRRDLLSIAPIDDLYFVQEDQPIITGPDEGVLANDPGEVVSALLVQGPRNGRLFLNPNGAFAYDPEADFVGEDYFVYRAGNGDPGETATVFLRVNADISGANAVDDSYRASKNRDLEIDADFGLLANDGEVLYCELVTSPSQGTLVLEPDGSFKYSPRAGYVGPDTFLYRGASWEGADIGQVTIEVSNDAPFAFDDVFEVNEDSGLDVLASGVLANDTDLNGDPLTVGPLDVVAAPQHGTLHLNSDGSFSYTPDADYNGLDWFTYRAFDGELSSEEPATATITVRAVNDQPMAIGLEAVTTGEDAAVTSILAGEDGDSEVDQTLTFALAVEPEHGDVVIDVETGEFTYTPDPDYNGPDRFSFTVRDDDLAGEPAGLTSEPAWVAITVMPVNDRPVASAMDGITTAEDTEIAGTLTGEDGDSDVVQTLTFAPVGETLGGNVIIDPDTGAFTFTPALDYVGAGAGFYFTVTDDDLAGEPASLTSEPAWVAITVTPVNDPPVAIAVEAITTAEDTAVTGTLTGDDGDPEVEQTLTYAMATEPEHGDLTIDPTTGEFTYTPNLNYNGPDRFSFIVRDDDLAGEIAGLLSEPAWVTIAITPVADPVTANSDAYITEQDTALIVLVPDGLLANDSDVDGDAVTGVFVLPEHGDLILRRDGSFGYMPDEGYYGQDSFTYMMGNSGYVSQATVEITVNAIPVAEDDTAITEQDTPLTVSALGVLGNDFDDYWGELTAELVSEPENG